LKEKILLNQESLTNRVKMNLCISIYQLALYIFKHNLHSLNIFSEYLENLLGTLEIDLTSEPFGHVVDKRYPLSKGSIDMKWQVTEPGQSRWDEKLYNLIIFTP